MSSEINCADLLNRCLGQECWQIDFERNTTNGQDAKSRTSRETLCQDTVPPHRIHPSRQHWICHLTICLAGQSPVDLILA